MPPLGAAVGGERDVRNLAEYVLSLSDSPHDSVGAQLGKEKFVVCAACHGADGKGNTALGAPNLTDHIWLFGGGVENIMTAINKGRESTMPAHKDLLGGAKVHILAAYVWGLSSQPAPVAAVTTRGSERSRL
jgi:cytochrome c oxidase cbb3-type subunit 3